LQYKQNIQTIPDKKNFEIYYIDYYFNFYKKR